MVDQNLKSAAYEIRWFSYSNVSLSYHRLAQIPAYIVYNVVSRLVSFLTLFVLKMKMIKTQFCLVYGSDTAAVNKNL